MEWPAQSVVGHWPDMRKEWYHSIAGIFAKYDQRNVWESINVYVSSHYRHNGSPNEQYAVAMGSQTWEGTQSGINAKGIFTVGNIRIDQVDTGSSQLGSQFTANIFSCCTF